MEQQSVLITGGSGLVGRHLSSLLLSKGYRVSHLSRTGTTKPGINVYKWDPENRIIDHDALSGVNFLIHLAGANIGEKRWTKSRKYEIISSRIDSAKFIFDLVKENPGELKVLISASAIGYYGSVSTAIFFKEEDLPGKDFLGNTCRLWEEASDLFAKMGIRTVKIRSGVVLEKTDSALSRILRTAKLGILPIFGNGQQIMPWIHIDDLIGIYLKAIEDNDMSGPYNAVSPGQTNNMDFTKILKKVLKSQSLVMPVPTVFLRLALGEMAVVVLEGSRISYRKISDSGYEFIHPNLEEALTEIIYRK